MQAGPLPPGGFSRGDPESTEFTCHGDPPFWAATFRGEGGVICGFSAKFKMKVDSDVLLLSYFDKICLILIGEPGRALAYLYSEARLYK